MSTIDNLEKVSYIYSANGCGKTTITKILCNVEAEEFADGNIEKYLFIIKIYLYTGEGNFG